MAAADKKSRPSKKEVARQVDDNLRDETAEVLGKFWSAVKRGLDSGDSKTLKIVAEMYNLNRAPGGTTIFNNMQVNNAAAETSPRVRQFDQIIRKLEDKDALTLALAAPVDNPDDTGFLDDDDDIQEAEFEDVKESPADPPRPEGE